MTTVIPILRVFDYAKTIEFYIDWLGFAVNWEHRPEGSPFYMQVSLREVVLDLSEHHGDGSPGVKIGIFGFEGLESWHGRLLDKKYTYMRPGLGRVEWNENTLVVTVIDPFSNKLIFNEDLGTKK